MERPELKDYQTKAFNHFDMDEYAKDLNKYIDYLEQETKAENLPISDVSNRKICQKANACANTPGGCRCPKEPVICPL